MLGFKEETSQPNDPQHYAFVGAGDGPEWEGRVASLVRYTGVKLIPYHSGSELIGMLESLSHSMSEQVFQSVDAQPVLRRAVLQNVGPFDRLEIGFEPGWNVLLGNNGVGKSSVLRALAVALGGKHAEQWADRVIKAGRDEASVTIETSHLTHRISIIRRQGAGADVQCIPERPMGRSLILGFPPLRTGTWNAVSIQTETHSAPGPGDVLPLLIGEADPRLDSLKQWLVNIDYRIKDARAAGPEHEPRAQAFERLIEDFFEVVQRVTEGVPIRFGGVDPATRQVKVITAEGEVPIELVSQGTASLISWVGVLLQRLYDVHGPDEPRKKYALVLIDEIDAHMHPSWQQSIIHHLSEVFPHIQVIATTHSPLIVAGRSASEVTIFSRNAEHGRVTAARAAMDFTRMRSDQILTSDAFGLDGAWDYDTTQKRARYRALLEQSTLDTAERTELESLRRHPAIAASKVGESPLQVRTMEVLRDSIDGKLAQQSPEESAKLRVQIDAQLREALLESEMQ